MSTNGTAQTVVRAFSLLSFFSEETPALTGQELSQLADLKQSTAHRLLSTLASLDVVERDLKGRYRLGLPVLAMANLALGQLDVYRHSLPILSELTMTTGFTSTLAVHLRSKRSAIYIARIDSPDTPRGVNSIGKLVPLHLSAVGRVLLAGLPSEGDRLTEWSGVTEPTRLEQLRTALEGVRRDGYSLDDGELLPHRSAIAIPVLDGDHRTLAALALSGPRTTLDASTVSDVIMALSSASDAISYTLGNTGVYT